MSKEMFLISREQLDSLLPLDDRNVKLQLGKIVRDKSMGKKEKFQNYSNLFQNNLSKHEKHRLPLTISKASEDPPNKQQITPSADDIRAAIIKEIPPSYVRKALNIFDDYILSSNSLSYDGNHVYLNGEQVGDNNLVEFLGEFVSRKSNKNMAGYESFSAEVVKAHRDLFSSSFSEQDGYGEPLTRTINLTPKFPKISELDWQSFRF